MRRADDQAALDAALPHEPQRSEAQVRGVLDLLSPPPKRVLELGCGHGRLLVPLSRAGHYVTGIDRDATASATCRTMLGDAVDLASLIEADFLEWIRAPSNDAGFDAILCVGNTFMTIVDLDEAIDLLTNVARRLAPRGVFILDDLPHDLWPQLTEGDWTSGISEDGEMQIVWHPHDSVFTIRRGDRVNPESWSLEDNDELYRLWTSGALGLAARVAGLSEPQHLPGYGLLVMRRAGEPAIDDKAGE